MRVGTRILGKTTIALNPINPVWDQEFHSPLRHHSETLTFQLFSKNDEGPTDQLLATLNIDLSAPLASTFHNEESPTAVPMSATNGMRVMKISLLCKVELLVRFYYYLLCKYCVRITFKFKKLPLLV